MSVRLATEAWGELVYMDLMRLGGFRTIQWAIKRTPVRRGELSREAVEDVVEAMKTATALYFKPAKCLQRSAVVTRLLRRRGVKAEVVIGCHLAPISAHAWVEVSGDVVSDDSDLRPFMHIVDRW